MKLLISIVLMAVCSAALTVAWHRRADARAFRAAIDSLASQRATLAAAIVRLEQRTSARAPANSLPAASSREPDARRGTPDSATSAPVVKSSASTADPAAGLEASPGLRALFRRALLSDIAIRHQGYYVSAGLSPEQIRRFEALLVEAEEVQQDFRTAARAQGIEFSAPELARLRAGAEAELAQALHGLLGETAYQQLQQFKRTHPLDVIVDDTAMLLAPRAPLTAAQRSQLLDTLARASRSYDSGGAARLETIDWPRALTEARACLTPAQYAILQQEADLQAVYAMVRQFYGRSASTRAR